MKKYFLVFKDFGGLAWGPNVIHHKGWVINNSGSDDIDKWLFNEEGANEMSQRFPEHIVVTVDV